MPDDLELLQGAWRVTALEVDGQPMAAETLKEARIVIEGSRFTSTGMGAVYGGTLELDSSAAPARLDLKFDSGPEQGNINRGIYELTGESWRLCLATRGTVRPTSFVSPPGSGIALEILVRGSVPKARKTKSKPMAQPPSGRATEFEGEWQMVSGVMNGVAMNASDVRWVKRVTRGNQTTVLAGPQTMLKVEFSYDPSGTIDYLNLAGAHKGKRQEGIYRFDGDVLTVCSAAPGAQRPAEFASLAGDGRTLTVWKRA